MFRRLGWFVGLNQKNWSTKGLIHVDQPGPERQNHQLHKFDAVHEVAIYIHRFHNLDLFQQGWYRIKVTMRWEDGGDSFPGIPARVVQYEAPEVGADNLFRVWMIDDTDNSFSTPPFRVRYARQDVLLSIMISFYLLPHDGYEGKSSAVILKFELMHFPTYEVGPESQGSPNACATSFHEYRIPPKALLGLHSYCPIHFDAFHAVLIDTSVHISLLKAGYHTHRLKSSNSRASEGTWDNVGSSKIALFKALIAAHDILLEDLRRISKGINQAIDLPEITFRSDVTNSYTYTSLVHVKSIDGEVNFQLPDQPQVNAEKAARDSHDLSEEESFHSCSWEDMSNSFQSLGNQLSNIWNTFLQFHRENKAKILEFLRTSWADDRRTEWSIWMVYTKFELPHHHYTNDGFEGTPLYPAARGSSSSTRRLIEYPIQSAIMRAELHRRGISQMRINNRSLQDMYIFGDPLRIPIIIVERLANINESASVKSVFIPVEHKAGCILENGSRAIDKFSGNSSSPQHALRVVVFVHGFQGHHLDLRLVRNQWLLIDPKAQFLMSKANEDRTSEDFRDMGSRLAKEVISFLKRRIDKASRMGNLKDIKLSFVGHSIGNLIIRTALAESIMEPYLRYLFTYVSVSGPHLGYMYSSNSIFNSGLWLLKKIMDIQCIHQLTFTDDHELENTFIYNLSKKRTLANFRNVILLSSPQDGYVPYHSARIELCPAASLDLSKQGKVFLEMLNNCLDQIRPDSEDRVVMRCDVNFETSSQGRNFNTLIGRAAHIEFLECDIFVKFIMWSFPELFM